MPDCRKGDAKTDCSNVMQAEPWRIICLDFDITNQLLIVCYLFIKYCRKKMVMHWGVHHPFIDFRKACDGIRRELTYVIFSESGVPMQLFMFFTCN